MNSIFKTTPTPDGVTASVVASIYGFDIDTVVEKLSEKNLNILNDDENPNTIENNDWRTDDFKDAMGNGFKILAFAGHANYNRIGTSVASTL